MRLDLTLDRPLTGRRRGWDNSAQAVGFPILYPSVTAIIGYDEKFYDRLPKLFPHADARAWFADKPELAGATARRNSSLQGAYFILAARALGLDCGPMSGFDSAKVDHEFFPADGGQDEFQQEYFPDSHIKTNFLCNLGYGDPSKLFPRSPRLDFDEACKLL